MINLDFLEYLIEFSKTNNLTKTSKSLHVSQSALTRAMQKVEDYVGVPIFTHSKNKLELNDAGQVLVKYAKIVLDAEKIMKEKTVTFHNSSISLSIGSIAPGPMIKYGNLLYSLFPNKPISSKLDTEENLLEMLKAGNFDIIFISKSINDETVSSKYAFTENLHISIPKSNPLSEKQSGVYFSDIDGQPFLVANNLAIWDEIKAKNLPNSKFIKQSMNDLYNVVSASTIPSFSTNVTIPIRNIPILDEEASVTFYAVFLKQNKNKIRNFLNLIK